jgi:hypothetical protein
MAQATSFSSQQTASAVSHGGCTDGTFDNVGFPGLDNAVRGFGSDNHLPASLTEGFFRTVVNGLLLWAERGIPALVEGDHADFVITVRADHLAVDVPEFPADTGAARAFVVVLAERIRHLISPDNIITYYVVCDNRKGTTRLEKVRLYSAEGAMRPVRAKLPRSELLSAKRTPVFHNRAPSPAGLAERLELPGGVGGGLRILSNHRFQYYVTGDKPASHDQVSVNRPRNHLLKDQ